LPQKASIFCGKGYPNDEICCNWCKTRTIKHGRSWCFTPKHFLDLDNDTGVHSALSRLEWGKFIRRLMQGLYDCSRERQELDILPPKTENVARAISQKMEFTML
jgi:hypothetical protein